MEIQIIYASASGNVEATMEYIAEQFNAVNIKNSLNKVEKTPFEKIQNNEIFLFATSTWEHGRINPFWDENLKLIKENDMSGKRALFVGLGDFRYETLYFCRGIDMLRDTFVNAGGIQIGATLKINGDPYVLFEKGDKPSLLQIWIERAVSEIRN